MNYKNLINAEIQDSQSFEVISLWDNFKDEREVVLRDDTDEARRIKAVSGVQYNTEVAISNAEGVASIIIATASPATPLTVREENAEECLAPAIYSNPKAYETVQKRWRAIDRAIDNGVNVIIAAPANAWDDLKVSQKDVWNRLSHGKENVVQVKLDKSLPNGINGALNIVGSEAFSINAGQAQASQWSVESGQEQPKVKEIKLYFGDASSGIIVDRTQSILKVLQAQDGVHNDKLKQSYQTFDM